MSEGYVEQIFPIDCKGRDNDGRECLDEPVRVQVRIYKSPGCDALDTQVTCPYITGGHSQRCTAFDLGKVEKTGKGIICPYAVSIPWVVDSLIQKD